MQAGLFRALGGSIVLAVGFAVHAGNLGAFGLRSLEENAANGFGSDPATGDVDGDGDVDIVVRNGSSLRIYASSGGPAPTFQLRETPIAVPTSALALADLDADGDLDIAASVASASVPMVRWYENDGGTLTPHAIGSNHFAAHISAGDVNGDGRIDLVTGGASSTIGVVVFLNQGGSPPSFSAMEFGASTNRHSFAVVDMDRDGDLDILSDRNGNEVVWLENTNGDATAFSEHVIGTLTSVHQSVAADFDFDGDIDIVAGSPVAGSFNVVFFENVDGSFTPHDVTSDSAETLAMADMDCDGDLDIVTADIQGDSMLVYRNDRGTPLTFTRFEIGTDDRPAFIHPADLTQDGRPDVVTIGQTNHTLRWYEQVVCPTDVNGDLAIDSADLSALIGLFGQGCPTN